MDIFYPFELFANWLIFIIFQLDPATQLAQSMHFFVYDILKIFFLLLLVTHFMSLLRYYLPIEKLRTFLVERKLYGLDYLLATVFGALTPFCSCSSIPLFIGFMEARIPLGVTFAFLITSPLINEIAIALFIGLFGREITLMYIVAGISVGIVGGLVIEKLSLERYVEDFVRNVKGIAQQEKNEHLPLKKIRREISSEAMSITKNIAGYVLVGVGLGAFIHGFVPQGFFEKYLQKGNRRTVPLAVILAVPLYSNASGVIPIIESLIAKGVPLGTALAFMMATVGLSLPEAMILKKVLKRPLLVIFFVTVTIGIILIGYLFNIFF